MHALPHAVGINAGNVFYIMAVVIGLVMWSFAIVWFVIAIIMIGLAWKFPFNMGWWGFIFPIGTYLDPLFFLIICKQCIVQCH